MIQRQKTWLFNNHIRRNLVLQAFLEACSTSLSSLTQLEELVLSYNKFKEGLPEVVGALKSLSELRLISCKLQDLPEFLSSLTHLKVLWLGENNFKQGFPEVIGSLTSLAKLFLNNCQLQDLPESLSKLSQLKELNITKNELKEVPGAVFHLTALTELDIRFNCELTKIDERAMALNKLQKLTCDGCLKLVSPPYGVCQEGIHTIREYFNAFRQGRKI
ncbi:uncharacterized protein [Watersipora subatra]|uniref:uncharacterized protein n=1 Tax=Watersipora subatra TaxID=2589382 RepID=UPI00355AD1F0